MATVESLSSPSGELSPHLVDASFTLSAALNAEDAQEAAFVVGSIPIKMKQVKRPFGAGEMQLTLFGDFIDGVMWAKWQERRLDTNAVLEFDYEWSVSDPSHKVVEISILNPEDLVDPQDYASTNGQVEMNARHERFLRRRLGDFYWTGKPD